LTIVLLQLVALRMLQGRKRTRALILMFFLAAAAWVVTIASAHLDGTLLRNAGFALAMAVFALGECLLSPTVPGMVNDLAPDHLRGRYNASYALVFSIGNIIGPTLAGFLLGAGLGDQMFLGMIAACGVAAYMVLRLEPLIPSGKNYAPTMDPAQDRAAVVASP
jgi:MFS family permease